MDVSIIIVSYNNFSLLDACIRSVKKFTQQNSYEIIVIDNNSTEGDVSEVLKIHDKVTLIQNKSNYGFGAANNQGIKIANGKYVLFLNNDTEFVEDSISKIFNFYEASNENLFIGCKLLNSDMTTQNSIVDFDTVINLIGEVFFIYILLKKSKWFNKYHNNYKKIKEFISVDFIAGAFIFAKLSDVKKCNGFDERFFFYAEEADLCLRFIKNYCGKVIFYNQTSVIHKHGATAKQNSWFKYYNQAKSRIQFFQKHFSGIHYLTLIFLHYLSIFNRVMVYLIGGILTLNSGLIIKSYYFFKQLFIYPKIANS